MLCVSKDINEVEGPNAPPIPILALSSPARAWLLHWHFCRAIGLASPPVSAFRRDKSTPSSQLRTMSGLSDRRASFFPTIAVSRGRFVDTGQSLSAVDAAPGGIHGWAVTNAGIIMATADGGRTWTYQQSGTDINLVDVAALSDRDRLLVRTRFEVWAATSTRIRVSC